MASISGWRASRSVSPVRPLPSVVGARTIPVGSPSRPSSASPLARAASTKPVLRRSARSSSAVSAARRCRPRETRCSTTAGPIFSCENPISMSMGFGRQIPGLDHRDTRGQQPAPALLRMHDPGQDDAVGSAADDRVEQRVLARPVVAALAQHQLVAGGREGIGQRLDRLQEHRPEDRRNDGRHQAAATRRQPPGQHVRHVTGLLDRVADPRQRRRRHLVGRVDRARRGDHRHAGEIRDLAQGDPAGAPARTAIAPARGRRAFA